MEKIVIRMHFEGIIESLRCKGINKLFGAVSKVVLFIVRKLRVEEGQQFRDGLVDILKQNEFANPVKLHSTLKQFESTASQCAISIEIPPPVV